MVGSLEGIGPKIRKCSEILLSATAFAVIVDEKREGVVVEGVEWSYFELRTAKKEVFKVLQLAMMSVCLVYDIPFQGLLHSVYQYWARIYLKDCNT